MDIRELSEKLKKDFGFSYDLITVEGIIGGKDALYFYIDGMVDKNGQPIGRVNYGIADGETYRFGGKEVLTVEDDVIANYDDAKTNDVVGVFVNLKDYAINSNMELKVVKWEDHDTNEIKNKAILICDGKLVDPNGVILIKKGAEG